MYCAKQQKNHTSVHSHNILKKHNYRDGKHIIGYQRLGVEKVEYKGGAEETFGGNGNILYLSIFSGSY